MPNTSEAHRFRIGNFHPTLLRILARKAAASPRKLHRKNRYTANSVNRELLSWCACLSLSVLYCLAILLLTRSWTSNRTRGPAAEIATPSCRQYRKLLGTASRKFSSVFICKMRHFVSAGRQFPKTGPDFEAD